ncbi:MAG TPA: biotin--[acetyl-CoA-carboxylase] ligase, partial [Saprospiraceae bacterium]|nr:biotin--[acetyl-CoA-carboxylase] ligase [Saprospiraceae bacterium]
TILSSLYFPQKTIKHFVLLPSTNDFATNWCQSDHLPPEGSLVMADLQTAGKGQGSHTWLSEKGLNLTFSMIYYPDFLPLDRLFALNMVAALAVWESLQAFKIPKTSVKWPNDVMIGHQKVAGILIRNTLAGKRIGSSVIGIGLNVNQTVFPKGLPHATSVAIATGQEQNKMSILQRIIQAFEEKYILLKQGNFASIKSQYLRQLYLIGQESLFYRSDGTPFHGTITGIKDSGHLLIDTQGRIEAFDFQTIRFGRW